MLGLLSHCPQEVAHLRKELLIAARHILATDLRNSKRITKLIKLSCGGHGSDFLIQFSINISIKLSIQFLIIFLIKFSLKCSITFSLTFPIKLSVRLYCDSKINPFMP